MQSVAGLLILGIIFHAVYSWSIFDIYFRSPLVHGMEPVDPPGPAPAKRLVLAVGDGLRADKLFEGGMERAPFLRSKVDTQGRWGVSRTRVPTESRPGHVALIAGFYEDVSAVTKGWKTNPVNFDSVFNESRHTWSFGSPDILPMFALGASDPSRVETFMYSADDEDFAHDDPSQLDIWVFERLDELLANARTNSTLHEMLHSDKIVLFLHLLGLDTNGHGRKPHSQEYYDNIRLVDAQMRAVEAKLAEFYNHDGRTAFVFTADHGMGNRGAHGDGHPDNTHTPLVAWGAGIAKPDRTAPSGHDAQSAEWGLAHLQRNDVEQADIAPLMSTLIGVPYPVNSVGVLPIAYLDASDVFKARAAFANARQILAQYLVKAALKRRTELHFEPFRPLVRHAAITANIQALIGAGRIAEAEDASRELIRLCIDGLRYYQTYDWLFLRSIISFGYVGWIAYSTVFLVRTYAAVDPRAVAGAKQHDAAGRTVNAAALAVLAGFAALLYVKASPLAYYAYVAFPVYFWAESFKQRAVVVAALRAPWSGRRWGHVGAAVGYIAMLEVLVYTYFRRDVLTYCMLAAGLAWPVTMPAAFRARHGALVALWTVSAVCTSVFTMLPVEVDESLVLILAGAALVGCSALAAMALLPKYTASAPLPVTRARAAEPKPPSLAIVAAQFANLFVCMVTVTSTSLSLRAKQGLPWLNALVSWAALASSFVIPVMDGVHKSQHFLRRLVVIYLSFAPVFVLLSISYETLFYFSFSITLLAWLYLEKQLYFFETKVYRGDSYAEVVRPEEPEKHRALRVTDMRIAGFFLLFVNVAFFGTGNIASVSSFSIDSVYRFTTLFNPVLMGALLIFKILIPFFLLSAVFGVLSRAVDLPRFSLFLMVMSTTDIMTLNFFFLVRDDGSWLEIGTTISHFIIASAFIVFQIVLFSVSHALVGRVLIPRGVDARKAN
ncbi:Glycosyl phosphatidyl inositol anchor synthesis [Polyrhizophydium stewartii]|uniref:GPI ethanolamine phosphate transferase 1 n=1 Tax=Polyrhizophydium stewartii TaxID=2732419 RepID=A0ABR4NA06_9FUNG